MIRVFVFAALTLAASGASAATIMVTSTAYGHLADADCNLFEAVTAANQNAAQSGCPAGDAAPVVDRIHFAIPGSGVRSIIQTTALVPSESVIIDGYTQPGAVANTQSPDQGGLNGTLLIELVHAGGNTNFHFTTPMGQSSTVRGLVLRGPVFGNVFLSGGGGLAVEGCYLGTTADGLAKAGSAPNTIAFQGPAHLRAGGLEPAARNLLAGAIVSFNASPSSAHLFGNLIGTDRTGLVALPIAGDAIYFRVSADADNLRIGGPSPAERNVIAAAGGRGIAIDAVGNDTPGDLVGDGIVIQGNFIGVGIDGFTALGNATLNPPPFGSTRSGVRYASLANSTGRARIGGSGPGEGNVIAYNGGAGVELSGHGVVAEVVGNTMFANQTVGIDLGQNGPDGVTPNDAGDADAGGANRYQNFPVLSRYVFMPGAGTAAVEVDFRVDSAVANSVYPLRVDFYEADGNQGLALLASASIEAANAQQLRTANFPVAVDPVRLVAVATDAAGRSSEFSEPFPATVFRDGFETPLAP